MQSNGGWCNNVLSNFSRPSIFSHNARSACGAEETEDNDGSELMGETGGTLRADGLFAISGNEARLVRGSGDPGATCSTSPAVCGKIDPDV